MPTFRDIIERETAALPSPKELDAAMLRQWVSGLHPDTFWHPSPYTFTVPRAGYKGPGSPLGALVNANPQLIDRL